MKSPQYTPEQQKEIDLINKLTREEMCHLWRFSPSGHKYFDSNLPYYEVFKKRLGEFGGFSPEISKGIGWD